MSDDTELGGVFNDYFINIAANLKEPIENTDLSKLKSYISSKVPDNFQFELPDIDEKQAKVSPLHKGGAQDELNSYRPISVLPYLSKLLEKFIQKHFVSYLDSFDLIHNSQSGRAFN